MAALGRQTEGSDNGGLVIPCRQQVLPGKADLGKISVSTTADCYRSSQNLKIFVKIGFINSSSGQDEITGTSDQDGGIGRYTLPPHTSKIRTTTNLNTKNNQN